MRLTSFRARLVAVAGLVAPAPAVLAADAAPPVVVSAPVFAPVAVGGCDTCAAPVTYGPVFGGLTGLGGAAGNGIGLFAPNPPWTRKRQMIDGQQQPACAVNSFPLSDWAYIRRYCGPTIIPGTCYGHFQTKWRKWEDHCPNGGTGPGCGTPGAVAEPVYQPAPLSIIPPSSTPLAPPTPVPMPMPDKEKEKTQLPKLVSPDVIGTKPTVVSPNVLLAAPALPDIPTVIPMVPERGR